MRGYIDIQTFFPAIVQEVQWAVEKWAKVAPDVTEVVKALREGCEETGLPGLTGQYETQYGLSPRFDIKRKKSYAKQERGYTPHVTLKAGNGY